MKFLILFVASIVSLDAYSQTAVDYNIYVNDQQRRIDSLDGWINHRVNLGTNNEEKELYKEVYFKLVDSMQYRINNSKLLDQVQRKNLLYGLYMTLSEVTGRTYMLPLYYKKLLQHGMGLVGAEEKQDILSYLITDPLYSVKNIYFYKYSPIAKDFLIASSHTYPDEVLKMFYKYKDRHYKDTVVEVCAVVAPNVAKNYLIGETGIREILLNNTNPSVMGMRGFFAVYNILSKGMVIVDDIVEGNVTIEEAHTISLDKRKFLRKMIEVRNSDYAVAD